MRSGSDSGRWGDEHLPISRHAVLCVPACNVPRAEGVEMILTIVLVALGVLLFGLSHLISFYFVGKGVMALEAQRDAYKRIALLAIEDASKTKEALNEVLDAVLEVTSEVKHTKRVATASDRERN